MQFFEDMDWDLWGPPFCQDLMDEDYLNEQACVEALRKSIERAENEIGELQKDLEFLKIQLTWADYKDWSDVCCTTLTEKISCLGVALQTLRDENIQRENGSSLCLQLCREPAEGIHEILKGLFMIWRQERNEQLLNTIGEYSNAKWKFDARSTRMDQAEEHGFTPTSQSGVRSLSLKVDEKRKAIQDVDTAVESIPTSNCATLQLDSVVKVETEQQNSDLLNIIVANLSLELEGKGTKLEPQVKATEDSDAMLHLTGGQKAVMINEFGSSLLTSNAEENRTSAFSVVKEPVVVFSEPVAVDAEVSTRIPLLDLQEHEGNDTTMLQYKGELIPHPKHLHDVAQSVAIDKRSLDFPINQQTDRRTRSFQSNHVRIATDFDLTLSAYLMSSKKKRPRTTNDNVGADQAQYNEIMKKIIQAGHCEPRTMSNLQKREMVIDLPLASVKDLAVRDATIENYGIIECQPINRLQEMVTALGELTVPELKVVAKIWEVEKVWKHRKATLVQLIAMKMTSANKRGS